MLLPWLLGWLLSQDLAMYIRETTTGTVGVLLQRDLSLVSVVQIMLAAKQPFYCQG